MAGVINECARSVIQWPPDDAVPHVQSTCCQRIYYYYIILRRNSDDASSGTEGDVMMIYSVRSATIVLHYHIYIYIYKYVIYVRRSAFLSRPSGHSF